MSDTALSAPVPAPRTAPLPLDPGERLVWQGTPSARLHLTPQQAGALLRGLFGLGLFLYLVERLHLQVAPYWDVWVIVLTVFFLSIPLGVVKSALVLRRTRYALTDRRALVIRDLPVWGRSVLSLPLGPATPMILSDTGCLGDVLFEQAVPPRGWRRLFRPDAAPGFRRIADAAAVAALVRQVQAGG